MNLPYKQGLVLALVVAASLSSGCTRIPGAQGYIVEEALIDSVQPGIDNHDSVMGSLGRPSFVGQFDQRDWYYVSRETSNLGFNLPRPVKQTILHVSFDENGNVTSVDRSGMENIVAVSPMGGKTPTLGQKRGFFEELFGNIGAVGAIGQTAGTADNPK